MFAAKKLGNRKLYWLLLTGLSLTLGAVAQGTFIYDQQSSDESSSGESGGIIQAFQLLGQSFTPSLSSVGFVRLLLDDAGTPGNGLGATVVVNLRANSIGGPVLGSTSPIFMPDGFGVANPGYTNFYFTTPVPVTSGTAYFFQIVVQSGDTWGVIGDTKYNYSGGTEYLLSAPYPSVDLWFREGVYIVPEPSSLSLVIGSGVLFYVRHKKNQKRAVR